MKSSFARVTILFVGLVTLFALSFFPIHASACACCADWGEWAEETSEISEHVYGEIAELHFSRSANLFITDAFPDGISGMDATENSFTKPFNLTVTREGRKWTLVFKSTRGERGALVLTLPETATYFRADLHDGKQGGGGGPLLYKEARLNGQAWGNGIFAKGITPDTKFRLVLQGRGNRCLSAQDFKSWNLQISGPKAAYSFYGSFVKSVEQKKR